MSAVYFIKAGAFVKIGFSSNPERRAKTLLGGKKLILPLGFDLAAPVELIHQVRGCRMRDERNMQLLFGQHWAEGEWFYWSPAFRFQMETMQFVRHDERLIYLRRARKALGIVPGSPVKEEHWGMTAQETLAYCRDLRDACLAAEKAAA